MKKAFLILLLSLFLSPFKVWAVPATMYVTPAGAGAKDGAAWASAMSEAEFETDLEGSSEAGDIYYIAGGTYTLDSAYDSRTKDGTGASPIKFIGVKSGTTNEPPVLSDYAYTTDRPLFAAAGYDTLFGDYYHFYNLRFTTTTSNGFYSDEGKKVINCYAYNSSGTAGRIAFNHFSGYYTTIITSEAISTNGTAIAGKAGGYYFNYIHDSSTGLSIGNQGSSIIGNIIDTCTTGLSTGTNVNQNIVGNIFYNNTTGINGSTATHINIINNIFDANGTGVSFSSASGTNILDYNIWDNTTDVSNCTKGLNAITADPGMTDPANGDFTVGSGSNILDAGMQIGVNQGVTGDYKWNIGADQDDNTAAGTGGGASFFSMN